MTPSESNYDRIYQAVLEIPGGRVATYGQIASMAGLPGHARQVGYALHALPSGSDVPWHRVINAQGRVSERAEAGMDSMQASFLRAEGVEFDENGRISLRRYRWERRGSPEPPVDGVRSA